MTSRITAIEYRAMHAKEKKAGRVKGAVRTTVDGRSFQSVLEARRYSDLALLQRSGAIENLRLQVKIPLIGANGPLLTPTGRQMHYVADFTYLEGGEMVIEDAKGFQTETYLMKRAVLRSMGYEIREIKRRGNARRGAGYEAPQH